MNEILLALGIDGRLLLLQLLNFGLLFLILKRFVYTPIIERIEQDEKALQRAKDETNALQIKQKQFESDQSLAVTKTKKRAEEIIAEAENVAKKIEAEMKQEMDEQEKKLQKRLIRLQKSHRLAWNRQWKKEYLDKTSDVLEQWAMSRITKSFRSELQQIYLEDLCNELEKLKMKNKQSQTIFLESAFKPSASEVEKITKQLGIANKRLTILIKKELLIGYAIEVEGKLLEANLSAELSNVLQEQL